MNFFEFHRYEIDAAIEVTPWDRWVLKVEKILGHSLDGDQKQDGYSLDFAYDAFKAGTTVEQYVSQIRALKGGN